MEKSLIVYHHDGQYMVTEDTAKRDKTPAEGVIKSKQALRIRGSLMTAGVGDVIIVTYTRLN